MRQAVDSTDTSFFPTGFGAVSVLSNAVTKLYHGCMEDLGPYPHCRLKVRISGPLLHLFSLSNLHLTLKGPGCGW